MPKKEEKTEAEMTFLEHLEEMRGVILRSLTVFIVALAVVLTGFSYFNNVMLYPLNSAKKILATYHRIADGNAEVKKHEQKMGPVYLVTDEAEGKPAQKSGPYYIVAKDDTVQIVPDANASGFSDIKLRSMSFTTPIVVWFYVGFLGAIGISLPAILYFIVKFVAPGLTAAEKRVLRPGIAIAILLFFMGSAFAFAFMLPMGIAFMSYMSESMQMEMFPDAQSYYSMVVFLTIAVGLVFELPLLQTVLIYLGVLDTKWLRSNRRMVFLVILIFATVVTPPDCITQISLTIPLYLMYEIALRVGERLRKNKLRREAEQQKRADAEEAADKKEYAKIVAKERADEAAVEAAEAEIDKSRYGDSLPDDYDPNKIDEDSDPYGYGGYDDENYGVEPYIDYGRLAKPPPDLGPNWDLNKPDTSFMSPDWGLNSEPEGDASDQPKTDGANAQPPPEADAPAQKPSAETKDRDAEQQ